MRKWKFHHVIHARRGHREGKGPMDNPGLQVDPGHREGLATMVWKAFCEYLRTFDKFQDNLDPQGLPGRPDYLEM